ncbi:class D beta-lactamase [Oxalobacteraceae sp. CFBP 13730]|nr:class D beta-lactamase [Oxalobacteraceae sp. CFBP 13730]
MNLLDAALVRFLFASIGCLAAGVAVWGVLVLLRRYLPALAMQRSPWMLGQVVLATTFIILMLPQAQQLHMLPVFDVDLSPATAGVVALPARAAGVTSALAEPRSWLSWSAWAWALAYTGGLLWMLARLLHGQRALARLLRVGAHLPADAALPPIIEVDAPISPMLVGPFQPRLLLPLALRIMDPLQRDLIVAHELTHWRRGDLWWLAACALLQAVCWFNPAMRVLRARLVWAQELGCDRDVLRGRPQVQRKAYAAALVAQLRFQHGAAPANALAFGGVAPDTLTARVALIRSPGLTHHAGRARCAGLGALALVFGANLALQPALAWGDAPETLDCTLMLDAATGAVLVEEGRCDVRTTPVSIFNIAVSLMGFDAGILQDAHTPALPFKDGYVDWQPSWRAATDPTSWIRNSTVWYAQQVTSRLGERRVQDYVDRFDYGNQDLTGGVDIAWIASSLQVSPREQAAFLRKVANRDLPVSAHAFDMTAQLLRLPTSANGWQVCGKTGTASGDGDAGRALGWFVGWATKDGRTVVFARQTLGPRDPDRAAGPLLKERFLRTLPGRLATLSPST